MEAENNVNTFVTRTILCNTIDAVSLSTRYNGHINLVAPVVSPSVPSSNSAPAAECLEKDRHCYVKSSSKPVLKFVNCFGDRYICKKERDVHLSVTLMYQKTKSKVSPRLYQCTSTSTQARGRLPSPYICQFCVSKVSQQIRR